mgnify:CR=1 FL=1
MTIVLKTRIGCVMLLIAGLSACTETANSSAPDEARTDMKGISAMVNTQFQDDGCEVLLEIEENGHKILLMPIQIEDEYKIHGAELEIVFHSSKIMQSKCQLGRPIVLDSIKFVDKNR